jgi:hypothetical protein
VIQYQKVVSAELILPDKISSGRFWEVTILAKKAKSSAQAMRPDPSAVEGIPQKDPHQEYVKKDAHIKQRMGAQR